MKIRSGFVSNSSSASFVISKEVLTSSQIQSIYEHERYADSGDSWFISETRDIIKGRTWMDNFDMLNYLTEIVGIDSDDIQYERD